jgi:hypothetical protein
MFIALIKSERYLEGNTIEDIMNEGIYNGFFTDAEDFLDSMDSISFYELPDEPLIINGKIPKVIFTIQKPK